jgi:hypothetical protein
VVALDVSSIWLPQNSAGGSFDRFVPICPLLGPLIFDATFWGITCWGMMTLNRRMKGPRNGGLIPCFDCGYDNSATITGTPCPECGEHP